VEYRASVKLFVSLQFLNLRQSVGLLGWGGGGQPVARLLPNTDIHALSGIRAHDPSVQAGEDFSYPRPRGHYSRLRGTGWPESGPKSINPLVAPQ
jgi:hypothetical protein